jgi:hypothetical protein
VEEEGEEEEGEEEEEEGEVRRVWKTSHCCNRFLLHYLMCECSILSEGEMELFYLVIRMVRLLGIHRQHFPDRHPR